MAQAELDRVMVGSEYDGNGNRRLVTVADRTKLPFINALTNVSNI